jgi:hypothetical protein
MPKLDPISLGVTILACALLLGSAAAWVGSILATRFDIWLTRHRLLREIESHIDAMANGAPEGGRRHRPF